LYRSETIATLAIYQILLDLIKQIPIEIAAYNILEELL